MSQEILFLIFMTCELVAIMALYTFWIIPRVALKTNNLFEERMLDKSWDIPAMLEDYTVHLAEVFSVMIKKLVPEIMGGYLSAGTKQLQADPENILAVATSEFLEEMPLPMRLVASKLIPKLQEALNQAPASVQEAVTKYQPGLDKR